MQSDRLEETRPGRVSERAVQFGDEWELISAVTENLGGAGAWRTEEWEGLGTLM